MKQAYTGVVRLLRRAADAGGILRSLEDRRASRTALWLRSLFAIYDVDDLVHLDLAWWTFDAMDLVNRHLMANPGARVFEYGSGASTVWMARRGAKVFSVDHDEVWVARLRPLLSDYPNVDLRCVKPLASDHPACASQVPAWRKFDFTDYVNAIDDVSGAFDLIVIDGRARVSCLDKAMQRLSAGTIIVFDNASRKRYQSALRRCPLRRTHTKGLTASLPYADSTMLLQR